ncbi:hypothetical protein KFL_009110030 [Klebsormidium nitens]|uniref:RCK N-terminal domain-containing protein n=1 Tax=Klebsormidium nitens TaxID=105231 RepID=A0A1Y1IRC7_KLENI|nr:hypothetical protein KFL_009110030 [Klebsormidium nitens]|eukprot:GAQ92049.1 hypothetical protein KFL_009110030 [Klebsormidium nitens]
MATLACPRAYWQVTRGLGKQVVYARQPRNGSCPGFGGSLAVRGQLLQFCELRRKSNISDHRNARSRTARPSDCSRRANFQRSHHPSIGPASNQRRAGFGRRAQTKCAAADGKFASEPNPTPEEELTPDGAQPSDPDVHGARDPRSLGPNFALFSFLAFTILVALPTLVVLTRRLAAASIFASAAAAVFASQPPSLQTVYPNPPGERLPIHSFAAAFAAALSWPSAEWYLGRVSYLADVLLEKHPFTYTLLLFAICMSLVFAGGVMFNHFRDHRRKSLGDSVWDAWSCLCASSSHVKEKSFSGRAVGLMLALGGLFCYSLLTSTMTASFKSRMEWLREGAHTKVMERDHIVVAGTNDHLLPLLRQLSKSHEFKIRDGAAKTRRQTVLLLSEHNRARADKLVQSYAAECPQLDILTRSGSLSNSHSFGRVAADKASAVILLQTCSDQFEADASAVMSILALRPVLDEVEESKIIVEVTKPSTIDLVKSLGSMDVHPVQNLAAKLFVQCTRQGKLIDVYRKLMDHEDEVINIRNYPQLARVKYRDVRRGFTEAVICGIIRDGHVHFHPKDNVKLEGMDKLMVIAPKHTHRHVPDALAARLDALKACSQDTETDAVLQNAAETLPRRHQLKGSKAVSGIGPPRERVLLCGWRPGVAEMAQEYDDYLGAGSELVILSDTPLEKRMLVMQEIKNLRNIKVTHRVGNPLSNPELAAAILGWDAASQKEIQKDNLPLSVAVISDSSWDQEGSRADKRSIFALLQAEAICRQNNLPLVGLTAELVDSSLGDQVVRAHPSASYIGTSELMGLFTSQVAEHRELNAVWTELLNSWGSEVYVKDSSIYAGADEAPTFQDLAERAASRKEVAIGYRLGPEVIINPVPKTSPIAFKPGDALVVISEEM